MKVVKLKSIAILTHLGQVYPPTVGATRRIWGLAKHLRSSGFNVTIITTTYRSCESTIDGVRIIETPPTIPLPTRARKSLGGAMAKGTTKLVTLYANPYHLAVLGKMAAAKQLGAIQIEFPYMFPEAALLKLSGIPFILDQHGIEVDFLRELAQSRGTRPTFADLVRVSVVESAAIKLASLVLCCSQQDRTRMASIYDGDESKYVVVENGVDESFFEPVKPHAFGKPTVLYMGSFDHAPNRHAISWLTREVVPQVRKTFPKAQFVFMGSSTWTKPPDVGDALTLTNVADVRPYIRGASVALSTVLHGSGTRLKTLEYMACGAPVVSTSKGAEGIDLRPGTDILVTDDKDQTADFIVQLLREPGRAKEMGAQGTETVQRKYTWKSIVDRSRDAYVGLLRPEIS